MTKGQQATQAAADAAAALAAVERAERALTRAQAEARRAQAWAALTANSTERQCQTHGGNRRGCEGCLAS